MTFSEYAQLPDSQKIVLLEIDIPIVNDIFINDSAGIWGNSLSDNLGPSGITITGSDGVIGYYQTPNLILSGDVRIGTTRIDNDYYSVVTSKSDLVAQDSSIYYDVANKYIYFHFKDFSVPWGKTASVGFILGFADKVGLTNGAYYDDIYYDPRIVNSMNLSKSKDALFFGLLQYNSGAFVLNNADGYFDALIQDEIISRPVRAYIGFDGLAFADFRQVFNGKIQDYTYDRTNFNLNIVDVRKFMTDSIPSEKLTTVEYPYLNSNNAGNVKPIVYGNVRKAPIVCVNEDEPAPANFRFYVADVSNHALTSVDTVYIDNIAMAPADWTYASGIITIAAGVSVSGVTDTLTIDDNLGSVSCDITGGSGITKGTDIIKDVLNIYGKRSFIAANYDLTEWAIAAALSRNCGVYINETKKISEIIEEICVAEDGCFIVKDNGTFTFRLYTENRTPVKTILTDEWITEPKFTKKLTELVSNVKVKYDKDNYNDGYKSVNNDTYETEVYETYDYKNEKSFETVLSDSTGATNKAETMILRSKTIVPTIKRTTKTQNIDLEVMDFVIAEHSRDSETTKDWAVYEVVGITKELNKSEVTLDMKYVKPDTTAVMMTYSRIDSDGNVRIDSDGNTRIVRM